MKFFRDADGKKSHTTSILWIGFYVATFKLLMSGISFNSASGLKFSDFTGSEYAIVLGALGALYQSTKVIRSKYENGNGANNGNTQEPAKQ